VTKRRKFEPATGGEKRTKEYATDHGRVGCRKKEKKIAPPSNKGKGHLKEKSKKTSPIVGEDEKIRKKWKRARSENQSTPVEKTTSRGEGDEE